jgi:hypothetical protein
LDAGNRIVVAWYPHPEDSYMARVIVAPGPGHRNIIESLLSLLLMLLPSAVVLLPPCPLATTKGVLGRLKGTVHPVASRSSKS